MDAKEKFCKDCGLAVEGQEQYCEFCKQRHAREREKGVHKADKVRRRCPVSGGWRGRPCGGGRGVTMEDREFFGDSYGVPVAADFAERVERSTDESDFATGIVDVECLADGGGAYPGGD